MSKTYDLAVVFDDVLTHFDAAEQELRRLCDRLYPSPLQRIDLAYLRPTTLMCRLAFDPTFVDVCKIADRLAVAQSRHFRVLDLMSISLTADSDLFEQQVEVAAWTRCPSVELEADLRALRGMLGKRSDGPERREGARTSMAVAVRFLGGPEPGVGLAREISRRGMYIETDTLPPPGTNLSLHLEPLQQTELRVLPATVAHVFGHQAARQAGRVPGFGVHIDLQGSHGPLFDSFLITAVQGRPWPERSGRRHDRFPMKLQAQWDVDGTVLDTETVNISRGGVFIRAAASHPPGTEGTLTLLGPVGNHQAVLRARVTHAVPEKGSGPSTIVGGLGLELLDPAEHVTKELGRLLGATELPPLYRALIIDDDHFFARLLGGELRRCGYHVGHAKTGEQALKVLMENLFRYDVIIVDLHLPGVSGKMLVDWLSKIDECNDILVVVVSATQLGDEDQAHLLQLGADEILTKNVNPAHMARLVDERVSR